MATSGIVKTTAYDSRYIEFAWSRKSYDTATNKTVISWTLTARGKGQYSMYYAAPFLVKIDGTQVYYSETRIEIRDGTQISKGEYTFTHNTDGSKSFSVSVQAAIYYKAYNVSGSGNFTLDSIPRRAELELFDWENDEADIKVKYINPAGNAVSSLKLTLYGNAEYKIAERTLTNKAGGDYNFVLTDAERQLVWGYFNQQKTVKTNFSLQISTVISGTTLTHAITRLNLPMINHTPTIELLYHEANEKVIAATGGNGKVVEGQSLINYTIIATPQKGATISKIEVACGDYYVSGVYSGTIPLGDNYVITAVIRDSREQGAMHNEILDMIRYISLTTNLNATIEISGETTATATATISGSYWGGDFGAVQNSLDMYYKIKAGNEEESDWQKITGFTVPIKDGKYSFDYEIPQALDYQTAYTITIKAEDELVEVVSNSVVVKATPVFDWSDSDFNFNVPVQMNGETVLRHNATANNLVVSASGGFIYFRVKGTDNTSGEVKITPQGNIELTGDIIINGKSVKSLLGIS